MDIPITFLDFKTEENYLALQNKFAGWDLRNPPNENVYENVVKTDFSIYYKTDNLYTEKVDYFEFFFMQDFLLEKISTLAKRYNIFFIDYIESRLLLDKEVELFSKIQLKKIIELLEIIEGCDYLIQNIKDPLKEQIDIVIEYLSGTHILPNYTINDKLKVNLNKTDILVFFTLLREKGIINSPYDAELGLFIDKNFLYQDSETTYAPIKSAGKVVNDIKNSHKPIQKSIDRLKDIFNNDKFYEIDVH